MYIIDKYPSKDIVGILAGMSAQLVISMIQLLPTHYGPEYQEAYNNFLENLNFLGLVCSKCSVKSNCTKHGYYWRCLISPNGKVSIKICRVKCGSCGATHALLPAYIVPYSQVLLEDQLDIIEIFDSGTRINDIKPANPEIGWWAVLYIIRQYSENWAGRLKSHGITFHMRRSEFIKACFKYYNRQFMQNKRTPNRLYLYPT